MRLAIPTTGPTRAASVVLVASLAASACGVVVTSRTADRIDAARSARSTSLDRRENARSAAASAEASYADALERHEQLGDSLETLETTRDELRRDISADELAAMRTRAAKAERDLAALRATKPKLEDRRRRLRDQIWW